MSLSDYCQIAFGPDCNESPGVLKSSSGGKVELYKTSIFVSHSKMWNKHSDFEKPCIARLSDGHILLAGFDISAVRYSLQNAMFVHVNWNEVVKKELITHCMSGIACSGFMSEIQWLKLNKPSLYKRIPKGYLNQENWQYSHTGFTGNKEWHLGFTSKTGAMAEVKFEDGYPSLEQMWTGIQKETYDAFLEWLASIDRDRADKIRKIKSEIDAPEVPLIHKLLSVAKE